MAYIPFPTGTILTFGGSVAPDGWLLCNGSAISRTTYARLFAVLSTTYGTGDGSTTFTLPDMRGVYPRGAGTNGTANYGGVIGHTPDGGSLANKGGQKTAKNGLTATSSTPTVSGTTNIAHSHGSSSVTGTTDGSGSHYHRIWTNGPTTDRLNWDTTSPSLNIGGWGLTAGGGANTGDYNMFAHPDSDGFNSNHSHGSSYTASGQSLGTSNISLSGSVSTPTITVNAGDTETTPAFLTVNYIIKL